MSTSAANLLLAAAATGGSTAARLQHGTFATYAPWSAYTPRLLVVQLSDRVRP
jgi:hypothetical protein